MNIDIKLKDLKAVSYAMATSDVRFYLNGVLVEYNGIQLRLTATDGHRLNFISETINGEKVEKMRFIIPCDIVSQLVKNKIKTGDEFVTIETSDCKTLTIRAANITLQCDAVDGVYPDCARLFSGHKNWEIAPSALNPRYVLDAHDALNQYMMTKKGNYYTNEVYFTLRGKDLATMTKEGFTAVIMPCRGDLETGINPNIYIDMDSIVHDHAEEDNNHG